MVNSNVVAKIKSSDLKQLGAYDVVRVNERDGDLRDMKDGLDKAYIEYKENQSYIINYAYTADEGKSTNVTLRIDCQLSSIKPFLKQFPHKVDGKYAYYFQNDVESRIEDLVMDKLDFLPALEGSSKSEIGLYCKRELLDILKEQGLRVIRCSVVNYDVKTPERYAGHTNTEEGIITPTPAPNLEQKVLTQSREIDSEKRKEIESEALKIVLLNPEYTAGNSSGAFLEGWKSVLSEAYSRGCDDFSKLNTVMNESEIEGILSSKTKQMREAC